MDLPIQHYSKENGAEDQLIQSAMRTEWEPCLAHHPPLQGFVVGTCDDPLSAGGVHHQPPPPPPPSKRRFRGPQSGSGKGNDGSMVLNPLDDRQQQQHGGSTAKMRGGETLMERQVIIGLHRVAVPPLLFESNQCG